ncbi:Activin_recp domain-containing protein [Caenorhabditis elegans]|uniref:Activin_recp domain-containing protein n=1 Tax=Caenorhabditis elegans TaxID=6239 RepID=Q9UAZ1_CAEEL|nr:Activin_recp domain-containing protein [Caenorhabditis elegans]CCD67835.1 Activin_recp domain-containing protein [Caenorhabditis elegans]|eukprot:NP_504396.1 Uncharacterized protein CELE_Y49G5B.1 [Caenorhabditis elegans]
MTRKLITASCLLLIINITSALQCYDCYGTGPDHKECNQERTCHGVACMIFDAGDNKTASAFCLLAMKGTKMDEAKDGCWLEPDGKGKHCMCFSDFCNKLVDRRNTDEVDPMAPLLPTAEFLKQNPLVDYDAPNLGDYVDEGSHPTPKHVLFPSADKQDPRVAGVEDEEDDLVPVGFADYEEVEEKRRTTKHHKEASTVAPTTPDGVELPHDTESNVVRADVIDDMDENRRPMSRVPEDRKENEVSASFKPPSWVLFVFPMAASWARFWSSF